jgi:hypothetical protein
MTKTIDQQAVAVKTRVNAGDGIDVMVYSVRK